MTTPSAPTMPSSWAWSLKQARLCLQPTWGPRRRCCRTPPAQPRQLLQHSRRCSQTPAHLHTGARHSRDSTNGVMLRGVVQSGAHSERACCFCMALQLPLHLLHDRPGPHCVNVHAPLWQAPSGSAATGGAAPAGEAAAPSDGDQQTGAALDAWAAERGYQWVDVRRQGPRMAPGAQQSNVPSAPPL